MVLGSMSIMLEVNERHGVRGAVVDHIVFSSVLQVNTKGSDAPNSSLALVPNNDAFICPK